MVTLVRRSESLTTQNCETSAPLRRSSARPPRGRGAAPCRSLVLEDVPAVGDHQGDPFGRVDHGAAAHRHDRRNQSVIGVRAGEDLGSPRVGLRPTTRPGSPARAALDTVPGGVRSRRVGHHEGAARPQPHRGDGRLGQGSEAEEDLRRVELRHPGCRRHGPTIRPGHLRRENFPADLPVRTVPPDPGPSPRRPGVARRRSARRCVDSSTGGPPA